MVVGEGVQPRPKTITFEDDAKLDPVLYTIVRVSVYPLFYYWTIVLVTLLSCGKWYEYI